MEWEELIKGGCKHVLANGEPCGRKIDGQGARLYCSECRDEVREKAREAKRERDRKRSAKRRKADRQEYNFYHFLYYHRLTEYQLKPFVDRAMALREQYQCLKAFSVKRRNFWR
jgi:hypothetical protein